MRLITPASMARNGRDMKCAHCTRARYVFRDRVRLASNLQLSLSIISLRCPLLPPHPVCIHIPSTAPSSKASPITAAIHQALSFIVHKVAQLREVFRNQRPRWDGGRAVCRTRSSMREKCNFRGSPVCRLVELVKRPILWEGTWALGDSLAAADTRDLSD